jgi:hypothetical protein
LREKAKVERLDQKGNVIPEPAKPAFPPPPAKK